MAANRGPGRCGPPQPVALAPGWGGGAWRRDDGARTGGPPRGEGAPSAGPALAPRWRVQR